jgi:hypothetical protein
MTAEGAEEELLLLEVCSTASDVRRCQNRFLSILFYA